MAFKSKINPNEVKDMTYKDYEKVIKKEMARAAKFGTTGVLAFSNFEFACGTESTLILLGKPTGDFIKFYKQAKKDRKKENDYVKGLCCFESKENEGVTFHIAISDGKGKPAQIKKNGKGLFKKIGLHPNIYKGELPAELWANSSTTLNQEENKDIDRDAEEGNDDKKLSKVAGEYKKAFKSINKVIIPILKNKKPKELTNVHFAIAKQAYMLSKSFLDRYDEVEEKDQQKFSAFRTQVEGKQDFLRKIAAKIKQELSDRAPENAIDLEEGGNELSPEDEKLIEELETDLADMRLKMQEAEELLDLIVAEKNLTL